MERKFQIFVSSTYTDLVEERRCVVEEILNNHHFPIGMEMFEASDKKQWDTIKQTIDSSDIYILLIGNRYGTCDKKSGISYTEMEYDYATSPEVNKPTLVFYSNDNLKDEIKRLREQNKVKPSKSISNILKEIYKKHYDRNQRNIGKFRAKVFDTLNKAFVRKYKIDIEAGIVEKKNVSTDIFPSIRKKINDMPKGGWVRDLTDAVLFYQNRSELPTIDIQLESTDELWLQFFSGSVTNAGHLHNHFFNREKVKLLLPHPEHASYADMCKLFMQPFERMQQDIRNLTELIFKDFPKVKVRWYEGLLTSSLIIGNPKSIENLWVKYEILIPLGPTELRPSFRIDNKSGSIIPVKTVKSFKKIWRKSYQPKRSDI